ncbi:hypothetical protein [Curtobacterium citreum]|uniref:hypothetical protein n=1 Tax=Curtobacterium citreum TaxID=2036 RepID=UPI0007376D74|nr:hypothetical protein [Curtobacterium citreum]KTR19947.1 hypothetical protein NS330_06955 [Curtobacterium citreum]
MNDQSDHPAFVRLRAELDAAWDGLDVLGELEDGGRERVVADLLTSVPDAASRAARETDPEAVVAEVRRRLVPDAPTSDRAPGEPGLRDDLVRAALAAATAAEPTSTDLANAESTSADLTSTEPTGTELTSAEPTPAEPASNGRVRGDLPRVATTLVDEPAHAERADA